MAAATATTTPPIAAFSNRCSPTLPSISSFAIPSKPSIQTPPSSSLLFDDPLTLAAATQAVTLANAAAQAARDAVSLALALTEVAFSANHEFQFDEERSCAGLAVEQKRRRKKRRKAPQFPNSDMSSSCRRSSPPSQARYLTPTEEAEFSLHLKEVARFEAVRKKIQETRKQELSMAQWAEAIGTNRRSLEEKLRRARECRERITSSYKKLVVTIASLYIGKGLSLQDLVQEGCMGLLRGAEKFDPEKGCKLSTYVYWWIKQAIIKAVASKSRIIHLPGSMQAVVAKIAEANNILRRRLGRWPTYDEIEEMVDGTGISNIRLVSERARPPISMDRPLSNRGSITLKEIIEGPEETRPDAMVARKHMKQDIGRLLKTLTEREERILRLYFGLNGETARSRDEIGRLLQLSRERVRQIQCLALTKLRQTAATDSLQVYV